MQRAPSTLLFVTRRIATSSVLRPCVNSASSTLHLAPRSSHWAALVFRQQGFTSVTAPLALKVAQHSQCRGYASKKGGKGGKGGKKGKNDDGDDDEDSVPAKSGKGNKGGKGNAAGGDKDIEFVYDQDAMEKKFGQAVERLKKEFMTMRTGTANPAVLDPVMVNVEGNIVPLRDLAQVSIKDAKNLVVFVHEPELSTAIEKAIREAGLNLNPVADNNAIRVPVPKPTKEFRENLTKMASASTEKTKTVIRNLRKDSMQDLKKDLKNGMSKDENFKLEKKAQEIHDKYIKEAEEALRSKQKEIMAN
ncbi:hypothetical protein DFQ27_004679 [Actinomortierella ambigua]|uniref:Ribosome recycling factor domain-containing protein n=1 Tax=Actinomortierella ambigua TaxID=1343610 RepID=A0A9P6Q149_9FUNG|nr:hypothetical protein DFQ27_004679 [Actinomortierella ambigua]